MCGCVPRGMECRGTPNLTPLFPNFLASLVFMPHYMLPPRLANRLALLCASQEHHIARCRREVRFKFAGVSRRFACAESETTGVDRPGAETRYQVTFLCRIRQVTPLRHLNYARKSKRNTVSAKREFIISINYGLSVSKKCRWSKM
jgi:hypothetical protein